jgi:hypothetical protein
MLRSILALFLLLGTPFAAVAAGKEIRFIATTIKGKPIKGDVLKRRGNETPQVLVTLGEDGRKMVTDVKCETGLQFNVTVRETSLYIGRNDWKDCAYGELKFVFNEVVWSAEYKITMEALDKLTKDGPADIQFQAVVALGALNKGDFGTLALATDKLKSNTFFDKNTMQAFEIVQKDAAARALGVDNGIIVKANGEVAFTKPAVDTFNSLKVKKKLDFNSITDPGVNAYLAKEGPILPRYQAYERKLPPG